jgi:hypothetical protein
VLRAERLEPKPPPPSQGNAHFCNRSKKVEARTLPDQSVFRFGWWRCFPRPRLRASASRRATEGKGGAEPPGATRSALSRDMERMASAGPSPERAQWHARLTLRDMGDDTICSELSVSHDLGGCGENNHR